MDPLHRGYERLQSFELFLGYCYFIFSEKYFYLEKKIQQSDVYKSMICGAIAGLYHLYLIFSPYIMTGICAKTFIAPAERIKMKFQVLIILYKNELVLTIKILSPGFE